MINNDTAPCAISEECICGKKYCIGNDVSLVKIPHYNSFRLSVAGVWEPSITCCIRLAG